SYALCIYFVHMNTAVINIKIDPKTKKKAQIVARELGLSLSAILNAYLTQLVRTKAVTFSAPEEPSDFLIQSLKESEKDKKSGRVSPSFTNAKNSIAWLEDKN